MSEPRSKRDAAIDDSSPHSQKRAKHGEVITTDGVITTDEVMAESDALESKEAEEPGAPVLATLRTVADSCFRYEQKLRESISDMLDSGTDLKPALMLLDEGLHFKDRYIVEMVWEYIFSHNSITLAKWCIEKKVMFSYPHVSFVSYIIQGLVHLPKETEMFDIILNLLLRFPPTQVGVPPANSGGWLPWQFVKEFASYRLSLHFEPFKYDSLTVQHIGVLFYELVQHNMLREITMMIHTFPDLFDPQVNECYFRVLTHYIGSSFHQSSMAGAFCLLWEMFQDKSELLFGCRCGQPHDPQSRGPPCAFTRVLRHVHRTKQDTVLQRMLSLRPPPHHASVSLLKYMNHDCMEVVFEFLF